ncbi:hypothetical protein M011DRAFT_408841 [Sporormia fimetaria CBS 119925]|uniref:Uncharacterized protein n=1 Tax=Sporormia fimetaria CBS 119925 TaxID=1340428 RepID=A0A6A6V122_9PLEO|nr:hypothetical protein M011DRAFT_408841 [Sporormia fimetaria CBS 119925]
MAPPSSAGNPLSAQSLATRMAAALPEAGPQLKNPYEAIALAVHAGMVAVGFRLIGLGEDNRINTSSPEADQTLPEHWNASSSYAFRYAHSQSAMEYILKVNRLGNKAVILGTALGDDRTTNFEVTVRDYLSEPSLPLSFTDNTSPDDKATKLRDLFISEARLNDLASLLKVSVIQRLAPGLYKKGYEEDKTQQSSSNTRNDNQPYRAPPREPPYRSPRQPPAEPPLARADPLANRPLPEPIPGFDDEYEIQHPPRRDLRDPRYPVGIGQNDLYPPGLGPNDPLRPHLGGGLPRPGGMGGGMHPTFDDPLFQGGGQGGGGYDPMAPPGARYDPVGPGDPLRDNRGGPRFPGRGGGRGGFGGFGGPGGNPFGGLGGGDFI